MKNKKETTKNKDLPIPKMNFEKGETEELKETRCHTSVTTID
jgi:hypothetical protein